MNEALPTVRQLKILQALARTGSFSEAARVVGISQSALSQSVAQMEFLLDIELVQRTKRSVAMTRAGKAFVQRSEAILSDLYAAIGEARAEADPAQGRVVVACISSVILRVLPAVTRIFRQCWPSATLVVREDDLELCVKQVQSGSADLAISTLLKPDPSVEFRPLLQDRFRFVCNHRHPLADRTMVEWGELTQYDFVGMPHWAQVSQMVEEPIFGGNPFRRAIYEVSRVPTVLSIVEEADVVSAIPALVLAHSRLSERIHHCPITAPTVPRTIGAITLRNAPLSATATAFLNLLFEVVGSSDLVNFADVTLP